nr:cytokine receptor common subunit beta-like [Pelodiscus sinensis]|eukprot:XP_025045786.1 cytokine receptor common subunit beta-like [Pelodiscus sinensis]
MHRINVTKAGNFLQAWKTAGGRKESDWLDNASELNVTYKGGCPAGLRKNSSSVSVTSSSDSSGKCDALVPSSTSVAHAGSKPSQSSGWLGQSSERSPAVSQNSQEGDEAQPKNLRCLFNGVDQLTCSWEVRREVASSVLFTLFYRATPASQETECSPVHEEELPHSPYLFQSCEINVTNGNSLSQYLITVRPKEEEKLIAAYKNIKPLAPVNVTVTKMKDEDYELRWTKQALSFDYITQRYEFQYWKTGDSEENAQCVSISNDKPPIIFTLPMLEPSIQYKGKMRARVHELSSYEGPWSEWSEECTWETESALSPLLLPLLVPVFTIMLITFTWWGCSGLLRKKKKWEEKIPNPSKSQVIQSYLQKGLLGMGGVGKKSPSEKTDQASSIQVLEGLMKVSSAELPGAMDERMKCFLSALDSENPYQTLETAAPAPPPSAPAGCRSSQATSQLVMPAMLPCRSSAEIPASQAPMSCFDFNGPYLHLPHECSLPDIPQHSDAAPFLSRGRPVSLEYVSLPEGSNSQTPLAGEARGAAQLRPVSRPAQEEIKQPPAGGQEGPQGQCKGTGEAVQGDAEGQRSLTAATPNNSCQKWPMGYVTTEGLSLMPASDSAHLSPAQAPLGGCSEMLEC